MGLYKSLFKQTAIYGLATVLPRMLSFLLVGFYTDLLPEAEYGEVSILFAYIVFFNVVLSYGMETAFFRFYNMAEHKENVVSTSMISVFWSSAAFLFLGLCFRHFLANGANIDIHYITISIWILVFDALVVIPFSKLRANGRPGFYALVKIANVAINLGLNIYFLAFLPRIASGNPNSIISDFYYEDFEVGYIFVANLISSALTFLVFAKGYFRMKWDFDTMLWKKMLTYALPVLFAGVAFAINEHFDKILLEKLLPPNIAKSETGIYSACYKIALFMTLFATAFRLGIEPFFFSHAQNEKAPETYAAITKYFVIIGSVILLSVIVFADVLKVLLLRDPGYWAGMKVVPLIILANFFLGIYTNLSVWYKLIDRTKMGAYISFAGAGITLLLNFLLIPSMSYYGSAIATLFAYGSMMAISYYLGTKYYPIPYDLPKIFGYLGMSIAFSAIAFYIVREQGEIIQYFINIPLLLIFILFVFRNEKATLTRIIKRRS